MTKRDTRRGDTQKNVNKNGHSRGFLSGIYNACRYHKKGKTLLNRCVEDPRQNSSGMTALFDNGLTARGFTLIELLVVVLIIGILAAVALPQYQKAVMKSRYAALMPIAKSLVKANEVYYMERGQYATGTDELAISVPTDTDEKTKLKFGENAEHAYVLAYNDVTLPNNSYIVYQKHSFNYPGEIHCEALKDDTQAADVCKSFGATENKGPILSAEYDTWLIEGSGAGFPPGYSELLAKVSCDKAEAMGYTCTSNAEGDTATKRVCNDAYCLITTYNEDGTYTRASCKKSSSTCNTEMTITYDEDGNVLTKRSCKTGKDGQCTSYSSGQYAYEYDGNGNLIKTSGSNIGTHTYTYDGQGKLVSADSFFVLARNADGNPLAMQRCSQVSSDGSSCETWDSSQGYLYTYDSKGNITSSIACYAFSANYTSCTHQRSGGAVQHYYTYDENNKLTGIRRKDCSDRWNCSWDFGPASADSYLYDADGNRIGYGFCDSSRSSCGISSIYTLDDEGKNMYFTGPSGSTYGNIDFTIDDSASLYDDSNIIPILNQHI